MALHGLSQDGNGHLTLYCCESPKMRQGASHKIPSVEIIDRSRLGTHTLCRHQLWFDGFGDAGRDLVLERKNVDQLTIVSLRPDVRAGPRVQKLACNAHALPATAHAAFKDIGDTEVAP